MQETEKTSSTEPLNVTKLLQLKRLERPGPDFWAEFDRELQQKQLQALVKPSRWGRVRLALASPRHSLGSLAAIVGVCAAAVAVVFSFYAATTRSQELAFAEVLEQPMEPMVIVSAAPEQAVVEEADEIEAPSSPRRTDAFFIVDALRPDGDNSSPDSFRTVAVPETFVRATDASASYVVNAFTTVPTHLGSDAALQF